MQVVRPADDSSESKIADFTDDLEPIYEARAARMKAAQKRNLVSNKPPPFHQSRSFIAAFWLTVGALVLFVCGRLFYDKWMELDRTIQKLPEQRAKNIEKQARNPGKAKPAKSKETVAKIEAAPARGGGKTAAKPPEIGLEASGGGLTAKIRSALVLKISAGDEGECLQLVVNVRNTSNDPVRFTSWSEPDLSVVLRDRGGQRYERLPPRFVEPVVIQPDDGLTDKITFQPVPLQTELELELEVVGRTVPLRFLIPSTFARRSMGYAFAEAGQPQLPAGPQGGLASVPPHRRPRDPRLDSPLHDPINRDFKAEVETLNVRKLGMNNNNAIITPKRRKVEIIEALAKKYQITTDEVRWLIDEP
jgi:hypothetical protein